MNISLNFLTSTLSCHNISESNKNLLFSNIKTKTQSLFYISSREKMNILFPSNSYENLLNLIIERADR